MTWTAPAPPELPDPPDPAAVRPMLGYVLAGQRRALLNVCAGLTAEQLAARAVSPSTLSLLGLVRHMRKVERTWFRIRVAGADVPPLFPRTDEDFDDAEPAQAEHAVDALVAEWPLSDDAVARLPLDSAFELRGMTLTLGWVYAHMIEEYARHNGHADLLRQAIDGVTGR